MKKLFFSLIATLLVSGYCYAAGTVSAGTYTKIGDGTRMRTMAWTFTADGSAAFANKTLSTAELGYVEGFDLVGIDIVPGTTGPTDDCDLTIEKNSNDILGGSGADLVDNAVGGYVVPYGSSGDYPYAMSNQGLILDVDDDDENLVNSAEVTLTLFFVK